MAKKDSNNTPYIVVIVILVLAIICGGIYFLFFYKNQNNNIEHKPSLVPETANTKDDENAENYTRETVLGKLECVKDQKPGADYCKIDNSKIVNAEKGFTYTLTDNDADLQELAKVEINKDEANKVTIRFDEKMVELYYGEKGLNFPIYLTFSSEVSSYRIAGFGQGVGNEYIFFVMKNGNVAMVSVYTMLKDKNYNPYMIKNVNNVTTLVSGSSYGEYGGGHTEFAVRNDKTAYDLQTLLPSLKTSER